MDNIISSQTIENTNYFKSLGEANSKQPGLNNKIVQQMLVKRSSREAITHQLILFKNGKELESTLSSYQLAVLNELIEAEKQNTKTE